MQAAAPKTYISKRMLDRYSEQRRMRSVQATGAGATAKSAAPTVPAKTFTEDANANDQAASQQSALLAPIQEQPKQEAA